MNKKDKVFLYFLLLLLTTIFLTKVSLYLNMYSTSPINHHSLSDVANCAEKVLISSKMYDYPIKTSCNCKVVRNTTYYKYTCDCEIRKKDDNELLQSGGSRILYEEAKTFKLKYNFWIRENEWYTGYCDKL